MAQALHATLLEATMASKLTGRSRAATAREVMNRELLSVREDLTLPELSAFLSENNITGAPVRDASGKFVGVVSVTDLAESESGGNDWEPGDRVSATERKGLHVEDGRQVRDIMTPTVYTVAEETPVPEIARAMISGRVHRLFVTRKGTIVGIVTSLDLLKLLCEDEAPPPGRARRRAVAQPQR
jgi:CBS domain-containing protein